MRRNYPKRSERPPEEHYDHVYRALPGEPYVSKIINHPRKLVIHNTCADPFNAVPEEVFVEKTCFEEEEND